MGLRDARSGSGTVAWLPRPGSLVRYPALVPFPFWSHSPPLAALVARASEPDVMLTMGWYHLSVSDHRGSLTAVKAATPGEVLAVIWNKLEKQRVPNSSLAPSLANVRSFPDPLSAAQAIDDQLPPATEPEPEVALPPEPAMPPPPAAVAGPILSAAEAQRLMPSRRLEAALRTIEGLIRESAERDADHLTVPPEVLDLAPKGPLMGKIVERLRALGYSVREPRLGKSGPLQVLWSDEADAG